MPPAPGIASAGTFPAGPVRPAAPLSPVALAALLMAAPGIPAAPGSARIAPPGIPRPPRRAIAPAPDGADRGSSPDPSTLRLLATCPPRAQSGHCEFRAASITTDSADATHQGRELTEPRPE
jgi:hypothetical protein